LRRSRGGGRQQSAVPTKRIPSAASATTGCTVRIFARNSRITLPHGLGAGVGRGLGVGLNRGVGVCRGVAVEVAVGVALGVTVTTGVAVAVGVAVGVLVGVGDTVGVGVGTPEGETRT